MNFKMPGKVYRTAMSSLATSHMLIAAGTEDVQVRLCDIASGAFSHTLSGHRGMSMIHMLIRNAFLFIVCSMRFSFANTCHLRHIAFSFLIGIKKFIKINQSSGCSPCTQEVY